MTSAQVEARIERLLDRLEDPSLSPETAQRLEGMVEKLRQQQQSP